ncbi:MAG: YfhO family protein [Clostridiales bacterium]|nr:YfhO family protein [Clostridiales bacterium]
MTKIRLKAQYRDSLICLGISLMTALLTAAVIFAVFAITGMAPLGSSVLLYRDGQNQMADLFCWYKDVLEGKASIDFSFAKSLGGSNFAVFAYYMASPFSLLVVFFDKKDVATFLDILFVIKTSLAAATAAYYLIRKFKPAGLLYYGMTVVLGLSYALSPFFICQSSNTMWLDGAYLLPLILAGVEKVIEGKRSTQLIICLAMSLAFNWYTGIINVMFSGIWFVFEIVRRMVTDDEADRKTVVTKGVPSGIKGILIAFVRFVLSALCSAVLAAAVLLPTLYMLSERTYGRSDLSMLKDVGFIGNVVDIVSNYSFGLISIKGTASVFAGSFVFIGIVLLFIAGMKNLKEKIVYGVFLLFTVMIFYWKPLVSLFSLLREVESFWYRYAYVGIFALVFIAASFYLDGESGKLKPWMPAACAAGYIVINVIMFFVSPTTVPSLLFASTVEDLAGGSRIDYEKAPLIAKMIFPAIVSVILYLCIFSRKEKNWFRNILAGLLGVIILVELSLGQVVLARKCSETNGSSDLTSYIRYEKALLDAVPDNSFVRRVQTTYHGYHSEAPLYASYNEPMAFGFNSLTSFVSDPEQDTIKFLDRAGYTGYKDTITVTTSENIALDSLLGVKYVLLSADDQDTAGLDFVAGVENFKNIFTNPYVLPVAFRYKGTGSYDSDKTNAALYLNDIYTRLSGKEAELYSPLEYEEVVEDQTFTYNIALPEDFDAKNNVIYASFDTNTDKPAIMYINGNRYEDFNRFLSQKQVRVAVVDGKAAVSIEFTKDISNEDVNINVEICSLDLTKLDKIAKNARLNSVSRQVIEDGYARIEVNNAKEGESLFTSIPYERGWTVTLNGAPIDKVDLIGGCLMSIPLEEGANVIEMDFEVPYKQEGLYISIGGVVFLMAIMIAEELLTTRKRKGE